MSMNLASIPSSHYNHLGVRGERHSHSFPAELPFPGPSLIHSCIHLHEVWSLELPKYLLLNNSSVDGYNLKRVEFSVTEKLVMNPDFEKNSQESTVLEQ